MTPVTRVLVSVAAPVFWLSGCGGDDPAPADQEGQAGGGAASVGEEFCDIVDGVEIDGIGAPAFASSTLLTEQQRTCQYQLDPGLLQVTLSLEGADTSRGVMETQVEEGGMEVVDDLDHYATFQEIEGLRTIIDDSLVLDVRPLVEQEDGTPVVDRDAAVEIAGLVIPRVQENYG